MDRPYFDTGGALRWNDSPGDVPVACLPGTHLTERATLMLSPRVDRVRCADDVLGKVSALVVGLGPGEKPAWQRALGFVSGRFTIAEDVIGASRDGVVLSNLTVLEPLTGRTLVPPATHTVGEEKRPVPDHDLVGAALYLPDRRGFLWFSADVTLLQRKGGLFFIGPGGAKELVLPVSSSLLGGFWRVDEMARAPDGRHVLLAQKFAFRGPGGVALAVFDPERHDVVHQDRYGEGHYCESPQVVVGPDEAFGIAYLDATSGERVLVRYRLHSAG